MTAQRRLESLTIVAPFYNEEDGAAAFHEKLSAALAPLSIACSFIFVDDGSSDRTLWVLNQIADRDPRVSVVGLSRNWGHQTALTAGLDYADGDAVVVIDSDLQHPPATIVDMIREYEAGADVVYGVRRSAVEVGFVKHITSKVFYRLLRGSTSVKVVEDAADFRLMARRVVDALKTMRETHRYLRGMVPWLGFTDAVVTYDQAPRAAGQATYTFRKSLRLARHAMFSFSRLPLNAISAVGVISSVLAGLYLVFVIVAALMGKVVQGWSSVIAVLLIVSAVQFLSISVLAQYLGMVYEQTKGRPLYVVKQERLSGRLRQRQQQ